MYIGNKFKKINSEIIIPLLILIFTFIYISQIVGYSKKALILVKPLLIIVILLSILVTLKYGFTKIGEKNIQAKTNKRVNLKTKTNQQLKQAIEYVYSIKKTLAIVFLFFILTYALKRVGFVISSILYLVLSMNFLGYKKIRKIYSVLIAVIVVTTIYIFFQYMLHVPFPMGVLDGLLPR